MLLTALDRFFRHDAAGGIVLALAAVLALVVANSPLAGGYGALLETPVAVSFGAAALEKPLILWINDGLMAIFFFLIGLELKRELVEGELRRPRDLILPGAAAVGGMALPAAIYAALNWSDPVALSGWAIPAATDIAFALGVLALLGPRVAPALKVFLLSLAILDDLGAIVIIAVFYTADLSLAHLGLALLPLAAMAALLRARVRRVAPTLLLGLVLWLMVLKSGVHATLAGVVAAFMIPVTARDGSSPLHKLETALSPYVLYLIIPIFAFANAGVRLSGLTMAEMLAPVPAGIAAGLVIGKQAGVFTAAALVVVLGLARLPAGMGWAQLYGVACLSGIGFTMSLFIGSLSFADPALMDGVRLGVLAGSAVSAVMGLTVLAIASRARVVPAR